MVDERWQDVPVAELSFLVAIVAALAAFLFAPFDFAGTAMFSITVFCIVLWIANPIPPSYTGVIAIALIGVTFSADLALVGFHSPATWLIGFGLLIGEATRRSGLAAWGGDLLVERGVPERIRADPRRAYRRLLVALSLGAIGLALFVPSALVRVLILAPILIEIGERFDAREAKIGLFLGPLFATFYGSTGVLTAGLHNIIITGILASVGGPAISWTGWFAILFPIMGLGSALLVTGVIYVLYRPSRNSVVDLATSRADEEGPPTESDESTSTGGSERRMLLYLLVGTAVWMTDFVHGLHPVFGALVVVILAMLPRVGVVRFEEVGERIDFTILFFLGAVFAVGDGLARTGVSDAAAGRLLELIPEDAPMVVVLALVFAVTILLSFLMEGLAVASVLTPILASFTVGAGHPIVPVMMTEAMALGTYFFPYQSAVLVAILAEDVVDAPELIRVTAWCSIASILLLVPMQFAVFVLLF